MCKKLFLLIAVLAIASVATAQESAENNETPVETKPHHKSLSLLDCVQTGLEHNLDIQINRIAPEIAEYSYHASYAGYDPSFNLSYTRNYNDNPSYITTGTTTATIESKVYGDAFNTGISALSPIGTTFNLNGRYSRSGFGDHFFGDGSLESEDQYNGSLGMSMTQPLLKNFWIDSTRLNIKVSRNTLTTSQLAYQYNVMTTIQSIENAYFSVIGAKENIKASEQNLHQAQEFLEETRKKVELGALIELDTKQAESQVASAKSSLIALKHTYLTSVNVLKQLLSDDFTLWQDVDLDLTDELLAVPTIPSRADSWSKGMLQRPDLQQVKKNLEIRNVYLKYNYNQLFPQLDVIGSYTHSGAQRYEWESPFTQIGQGTHPGYTIGGQLSLPLGNIQAKNNYKTQKAERERLILQLKQKEQSVMIEIDDAINSINSSLEAVYSTREASQFAKASWEAGKTRLELGKATSFEVLQLQTDMFTRKLEEIKALVSYNQNLANLTYMEGSTLDKYNITISFQ